MSGIIYIVGPYGAGKSTLTDYVLDNLESIRFLPTYTTRAFRPGENKPRLETTYVSKDEYQEIRARKKAWDHTEIMGNYYGSDASAINADIVQGQWFIVAAPTSIEQLRRMQAYYTGSGKVIYIDTDVDIANKRLVERDGKIVAQQRINDALQAPEALRTARSNADIIFQPSDNLEDDKKMFFDIVSSIIDDKR